MEKEKSQQEILKQLRQVALMVMQAAQADTLEQMLQRVADIARELIGARYAALGVPDHSGGLRFFKVSGVTREEIAEIHHPPVGLGLLGSIMQEKEPIRVEHIRNHPHSVGFPEGHPHMESLLGVPIQLGEQLFGIFYLTDKENGMPFNEDDQWMLEIMAGYAALVIAEKHLQDQRNEITLMRERDQIGMTLHDSIIQSLYALGMRLDLARRQNHVSVDDVEATLEGLNHVIEDIRDVIFHLSEDNRNTPSLRRRLKKTISQLYIPPELDVAFDLPEHPVPLSYELLETIEMMTNECLSNVIRHADAQNVTIKARDEGNIIHLIIRDDGKGFNTDELVQQQGLGLRNLQRRARIHGGSARITSSPYKGTQVEIELPID